MCVAGKATDITRVADLVSTYEIRLLDRWFWSMTSDAGQHMSVWLDRYD